MQDRGIYGLCASVAGTASGPSDRCTTCDVDVYYQHGLMVRRTLGRYAMELRRSHQCCSDQTLSHGARCE